MSDAWSLTGELTYIREIITSARRAHDALPALVRRGLDAPGGPGNLLPLVPMLAVLGREAIQRLDDALAMAQVEVEMAKGARPAPQAGKVTSLRAVPDDRDGAE